MASKSGGDGNNGKIKWKSRIVMLEKEVNNHGCGGQFGSKY